MQSTQRYFIPLARFGLRPTSAQLELCRKTPIGQDYTGFLSFLNLLHLIMP